MLCPYFETKSEMTTNDNKGIYINFGALISGIDIYYRASNVKLAAHNGMMSTLITVK